MTLRRIALLTLMFGMGACREGGVKTVQPSLALDQSSLDFGYVRRGGEKVLPVTLSSRSQAAVVLSSLTVAGPGAAAFSVEAPPAQIAQLGDETVVVRFHPLAARLEEAELVIGSNDPDHASVRIPLRGEGADPRIEVLATCNPTGKPACRGSAVQAPPSLDFGDEPLVRQAAIPATELPAITVLSQGFVELSVTDLSIEGADAAAFTFTATSPGLTLDRGEGFNAAIRFKPLTGSQTAYAAEAVVRSDDPSQPEVRIPLTGRLRPNLPPVVCANLTYIRPGDGAPEVRYDTAAAWAPYKSVPAGGYDFRDTREVPPKSLIRFSASSSTDTTECSSDPDDGRLGLTYQWRWLGMPEGAGALAIGGASSATATIVPIATGDYTLELTVKDALGLAASAPLTFRVATRKDLVAQLSWNAPEGGFPGVDLDLHLVRPSAVTSSGDPFSGVFSYFQSGSTGKTSGDLNGFSRSQSEAGLGDFGWGEAGEYDDPRLQVDDTGSGALIESISLDHPENDPACATSRCSYKVLVHYFRDSRLSSSPAGCTVGGGCQDGDRCDCPAGLRCVAQAASSGSAPSGNGTCHPGPAPVLRIFLRGSAAPAATVPLPADPRQTVVGAPCQMLYLADVVWPAKSEPDGGVPEIAVRGSSDGGTLDAPVVGRFGIRSPGSLSCADNERRNGGGWYSAEPR
jgi:hypothetical protein